MKYIIANADMSAAHLSDNPHVKLLSDKGAGINVAII